MTHPRTHAVATVTIRALCTFLVTEYPMPAGETHTPVATLVALRAILTVITGVDALWSKRTQDAGVFGLLLQEFLREVPAVCCRYNRSGGGLKSDSGQIASLWTPVLVYSRFHRHTPLSVWRDDVALFTGTAEGALRVDAQLFTSSIISQTLVNIIASTPVTVE